MTVRGFRERSNGRGLARKRERPNYSSSVAVSYSVMTVTFDCSGAPAAAERPADSATAVDAASEREPVGVRSNCRVLRLVGRTLDDAGTLGYDGSSDRSASVGDGPEGRGGVEAVGGRAVFLGAIPPSEALDELETVAWD